MPVSLHVYISIYDWGAKTYRYRFSTVDHEVIIFKFKKRYIAGCGKQRKDQLTILIRIVLN